MYQFVCENENKPWVDSSGQKRSTITDSFIFTNNLQNDWNTYYNYSKNIGLNLFSYHFYECYDGIRSYSLPYAKTYIHDYQNEFHIPCEEDSPWENDLNILYSYLSYHFAALIKIAQTMNGMLFLRFPCRLDDLIKFSEVFQENKFNTINYQQNYPKRFIDDFFKRSSERLSVYVSFPVINDEADMKSFVKINTPEIQRIGDNLFKCSLDVISFFWENIYDSLFESNGFIIKKSYLKQYENTKFEYLLNNRPKNENELMHVIKLCFMCFERIRDLYSFRIMSKYINMKQFIEMADLKKLNDYMLHDKMG